MPVVYAIVALFFLVVLVWQAFGRRRLEDDYVHPPALDLRQDSPWSRWRREIRRD